MQFDGFQAARAGLKKHAPQLAASGTGGSYFIADEQARHPLQVLTNPLPYPSRLFARHSCKQTLWHNLKRERE